MVIVMLTGSIKKGFTLIEIMIALSIFGIISTAVFKSVTESVSQSRGLKERVIAQWIAENEIAKLRMHPRDEKYLPALGIKRYAQTMAMQNWHIEVRSMVTDNPLMRRIEVSVFQDSAFDKPVIQLTGFLGRY